MVSARDVIFNEKAFFDGKPIKITTELMTALDEVVDLVKIQPTSNFEDIQFEEDEKLPTDVIEDLINIDDFKDDIKDEKLSNKLLNEGFYFIPLPSVYFLD